MNSRVFIIASNALQALAENATHVRKEKKYIMKRSAGGICTIADVNCMFVCGCKHYFFGVIVSLSNPCPLPEATLVAPDKGVVAVMLDPSSAGLLPEVEGFDALGPRALIVIDNPSAACALFGAALTAAETGVVDLVGT